MNSGFLFSHHALNKKIMSKNTNSIFAHTESRLSIIYISVSTKSNHSNYDSVKLYNSLIINEKERAMIYS